MKDAEGLCKLDSSESVGLAPHFQPSPLLGLQWSLSFPLNTSLGAESLGLPLTRTEWGEGAGPAGKAGLKACGV